MSAGEQRGANWMLVIGGVVLVLCGIAIFAAPGLFLEALTVWAGVAFIISGVMGLVSYFQVRKHLGSAGWHLFMAVLDFIVGIMLIAHSLAFAGFIPWMLGITFIAFGVAEVMGLMPFSRLVPETRTISVISGVLSALVGVMFIVWPASLSLWVAAFALVRGITLVGVGFFSHR